MIRLLVRQRAVFCRHFVVEENDRDRSVTLLVGVGDLLCHEQVGAIDRGRGAEDRFDLFAAHPGRNLVDVRLCQALAVAGAEGENGPHEQAEPAP